MHFHRLFASYLIYVSVLIHPVRAQLCTGSLGDPVLKIDFGNGMSSYPFTAPGYQLTTNTCPNDGQYYITTFQSDCGRQWHSVRADRTGGGAFMVVNASNNPGDFFLQTVSNLCPNTTYEFSAWVLNVVNNSSLIKPNLTFRVESPSGAVINQYSTGDIGVHPQPTWEPYGFYFTTGQGVTTVILRITNNAPGGNGNDLALDDIQFRPCGPTLRSVSGSGQDTARFCEYNQTPITFQGTLTPGFSTPVFQWQVSTDTARSWTDIPGATSLQFTRLPTISGYYLYRLTVAEAGSQGIQSCRIASNIQLVEVSPKPGISAGPDRTKLAGRPVQLLALSDGAVGNRYSWVPPIRLSDASVLSPVADPPQIQTYQLTVTSQKGCVNTDEVIVNVIDRLYIPNAFTPNGDGKNDRWNIPYLDLSDGAQVQVFDRAGKMIFASSDGNIAWNGTFQGMPSPPGVYVYLIRFRDGFTMKGHVTLLR